jgi:small subunit ribosomal protein S14
MIRNTALPDAVRMKAQFELRNMHSYTRPTQIKNRCIMGGVARSVLRKFKMGRFQFRMNALEGTIPGVKKASW